MSKTIGAVAVAANTPTSLLYDGFNPVQETTPSAIPGGATSIASELVGVHTDEYFARADASGSVSFLTDRLGSTVGLANAAGAVQTTYTYDPFGGAALSGTANSNPYQFAGRENDGTGLYPDRIRYLSPTMQRFVSQDPIEFGAGDFNLYGYVGNDPTNFTDPLGLARFVYKPLDFGPGGQYNVNAMDNTLSLAPYDLVMAHEFIIFDDGTTIGFGSIHNYPFLDGWRLWDSKTSNIVQLDPTHYDDALLREAIEQIDQNPGEYDLLTNNCQVWCDKVKVAYEKLRHRQCK